MKLKRNHIRSFAANRGRQRKREFPISKRKKLRLPHQNRIVLRRRHEPDFADGERPGDFIDLSSSIELVGIERYRFATEIRTVRVRNLIRFEFFIGIAKRNFGKRVGERNAS